MNTKVIFLSARVQHVSHNNTETKLNNIECNYTEWRVQCTLYIVHSICTLYIR